MLARPGPLLCGGITVFNPIIQCGIKPTDSVAVIGIGGLGPHGVEVFCAPGCCDVTAFTTSDSKREEALRLGAHRTLNSRNADELAKAAGKVSISF